MDNAISLNKARRRVAAVLLGLSAAGIGGIASASATIPDADVPSVVVRYGDLNLASEQGARALYQRIAWAAKQVCPERESRDLESLSRSRTCQKDAIERAVQSVHSDSLAAIYATAY